MIITFYGTVMSFFLSLHVYYIENIQNIRVTYTDVKNSLSLFNTGLLFVRISRFCRKNEL